MTFLNPNSHTYLASLLSLLPHSMADNISEMPSQANSVRTKKPRNSRKALKDKNASADHSLNIVVAKAPQPSLASNSVTSGDFEKDNCDAASQPRTSPKKVKAASKKQSKQSNFERELQEMQEQLEQLRLEKKRTEEILKEKDDMLKQKEAELETRGVEQEKLQVELKNLKKLKEFKPTMTFPLPKDKEQDKKDKKKNGVLEKKRPSPPYALWLKDQWNEIKKENPDAEFKEISNILGNKWKNLSTEEKQPYEERYQADKEACLREVAEEKRGKEAMRLFEEEQKQKTAMELLEQYMQYKQETEKENKKIKKEKDPLKPKHPLSAYFLFTNERRATLLAENKSILEVTKITSEEWKNMSEKQKRPYEEKAKKNKEKYMQEMEAYKQMKAEEIANLRKEEEEHMKLQKQEALQLLKRKEKAENLIKKTRESRRKRKHSKEAKKNCDPNKPKRPASSFLLYSKQARKTLLEERPGINNSTLSALVSVKWKELSDEERQVWNEKAAEAMEAYKKELEEYSKSIAAIMDQNKEIQ